MTRAQLEHLIRASGMIADADDLIVVGSQAVLGAHPNAPVELLASVEADIFPMRSPDLSELIDAAIGEGSRFEQQYGYYAHGVDETTATLPNGWRDRLVLIAGENTRGIRGWCLETHDLAISKYVAGREKDRDFTAALARHRLTLRRILENRLAVTDIHPEVREIVHGRIAADFEDLA
jgi:hypothetical protein